MCPRFRFRSEFRERNPPVDGSGTRHESRLKQIHLDPKLVRTTSASVANGSYRRKFKADLADVTARVATTLRSLGRAEGDISADEIEAFCRHAGYLKVIRYRSLEEEYSSPRTKFIRKCPLDNVH